MATTKQEEVVVVAEYNKETNSVTVTTEPVKKEIKKPIQQIKKDETNKLINSKQNTPLAHIKKNEKGYITPNHYYGNKYQLLDIIEDQLNPLGVRGYLKGIILKYLYGVDKTNALRRCTKAKYYLDELIIFLKNQGEVTPSQDILKPHYYNKGNIEVIDIIDDQLSKEEIDGFYIGMVIRYVSREYNKGKLEDLEKASYYLNRFISKLSK